MILPFLFVSAGVVIQYWQAYVTSQLPAKREYLFEATAPLIYRGLNAPVVVLQTLWGLYLPFYHSDQFQVVLGIPLSLVLFFRGRHIPWAAIGMMLDRRIYLQPEACRSILIFPNAVSALIVSLRRTSLLRGALSELDNHLNATNPNGAFVEGCLYLAWSLVLAVYRDPESVENDSC